MGKMTRYLAIGLTLSLLLNMFLIGFMLGRAGTHHRAGSRPPSEVNFTLRALASQLPSDVREELRAEMRERRRELVGTYRDLSEARRTVRELMVAETVDPVALLSAFDQVATAESELRRTMNEVIIEAARQLPQAERQKVVDAMEDHKRRRRGKTPD